MAHFPRRVATAFLAALAAALSSCSFLMDPPLRILAVSPSAEVVEASSVDAIRVDFSRVPRKVSAEEAFSLRADGNRVPGRFSWEGASMRFVPDEGLLSGRKYEIAVEVGAEDEAGVSLELPYKSVFSTRGDSARPSVLSISPANGSVLDDRFVPVVIAFSEAMEPSGAYRSIVSSPSFKAGYSWSQDGRTCTITPLEALDWQTEYLVTVQSSATDLSGNLLGSEASTRFRIGTESEAPVLLSAKNLVSGLPGGVSLIAALPTDTAAMVVPGWETQWGLSLVFSEPVLADTVKAAIQAEPSFGYDVRSDGGDSGASYRIVPTERLRYGTTYSFTLRKGVEDLLGNKSRDDMAFHFKVDGPSSRPPEILSMAFRKNPEGASAEYALYDMASDPQYGVLPLDPLVFVPATTKRTYLDLVVRLASGAALDPFSLMESFSVSSTNSCASFSPMKIDYPVADPAVPPPAGAAAVRVWIDVTNRNASGLLTFRIASGFHDDKANSLAGEWVLPLNK